MNHSKYHFFFSLIICPSNKSNVKYRTYKKGCNETFGITWHNHQANTETSITTYLPMSRPAFSLTLFSEYWVVNTSKHYAQDPYHHMLPLSPHTRRVLSVRFWYLRERQGLMSGRKKGGKIRG